MVVCRDEAIDEILQPHHVDADARRGLPRAAHGEDAAPEHRPTYVGKDLSALRGPLAPITSDVPAGDDLDDLRARVRARWGSASTSRRDS